MSSLYERFCSDSEIKQTYKSHNTSELLEVSQQKTYWLPEAALQQYISLLKEALDLERENKFCILQTPVIILFMLF